MLYLICKEGLRVTLDFLKYEGRELLRGVFLSENAHLVICTHLALDRLNRSFGV